MEKVLNRIPIILITLFTLLTLSSCDYFLPAPYGRDNPDDDGAQIRAFNALISGDKSIVTVWDWEDSNSTVPESQIIDKIRIVHKEDGRPTTWNPLNKDEVVEIVGNTEWKHEWTNLKQDRDHWFALYPHEKGGTWLAPRYTRVYLDYNISSQTVPLNTSYSGTSPTEFEVTVVTYPFSSSNVSNSSGYTWNAGDFLVLRFHPDQTIFFTQFLLHLENTAAPGSDVNLTMYPVKKNVGEITGWPDMISSDTLDYGHAQTGQVLATGGTNQAVDMAEAANRMFLYTAHSVAIIADGNLTINIDAWSIDSSYWGN